MTRKTAVAAHALIKKGNRYLVTKRSKVNDYKPSYWDLPGGTVEFGEGIEKALNREVLEETDLKIKAGKILFVYGNYEPKHLTHHFQLIFKAEYKKGQVKLNPKEHSEYKWLQINEIRKLKNIAFLKSFLQT